MDNLQSVTYQTFEQDPVKYHHYEEVIRLCLFFTFLKLTLSLGDIPRTGGLAGRRKNAGFSSPHF
jgi:hypothetical protein